MNLFMTVIRSLMALLPIPHMFAMRKSQSSQDQSLLSVIGVVIGVICWIGYGVSIGDPTLIIANSAILTTNLAYLGTVIYYRIGIDAKRTSTNNQEVI